VLNTNSTEDVKKIADAANNMLSSMEDTLKESDADGFTISNIGMKKNRQDKDYALVVKPGAVEVIEKSAHGPKSTMSLDCINPKLTVNEQMVDMSFLQEFKSKMNKIISDLNTHKADIYINKKGG